MKQGILTIAQGDKRYIDMAKMLATSLLLNAPDIKRAIVTDVSETEFDGLFDIYIPCNEAYGKGFSQKLYIDKYSPFDETIFIDADCLIVSPLNNVFKLCAPHSFVVFGDQICTGEWFMDVAEVCKRFNVPSLPQFNGGLYYVKKDEVSAGVFNTARELMHQYTQIGLSTFRGAPADEPLFAVAMAINKINAIDDLGFGMRTPIGIIGPLYIDVLKQKCIFNKEGVVVKPAVLHFPGSYADTFYYKRETVKLKLARSFSFINLKMISLTVNVIFNTGYALLIFCKRIIKTIIRKERFDFKNPLPVFSNK